MSEEQKVSRSRDHEPHIGSVTSGQPAVAEWVGDFKLMAGLLGEIEDAAHHTNDTKDWSNRLCDAAFFAQRVAHVMLDLQPKHLEMLEVLREIFVDGPVQVAFAGNPIACDALEVRALAAIAKAEGRQ